jgi:hypothetical protein
MVGFNSGFGVKGQGPPAMNQATMPVVNGDKRFNHLIKMFG